jgi:hypothetical protein
MGVDSTELHAWIAAFLEWCHSPLFQQAWEPFKTIYNVDTGKFIDIIMAHANGNKIKNPEDLYNVASEILQNPEFRAIIKQ